MAKRAGFGILVAAGLIASWSLARSSSHAEAKGVSNPNILFIIMDDVGIDQMKLFGFGGTPAAAMPNIAKIAKRGVKFTNTWAMPECSPTRAAFFTGRYPVRTGVDSAIVENHLPQEYVSQYEATLPRVLAKAGYVSAMIGKYHLGNDKDPAGNCAPTTRGWHRFVGSMAAGPPSIDMSAGGADSTDSQVCGYFQTSDPGACYTLRKDNTTKCKRIDAANADPNTTPARTCLQAGGLFRPNTACGASVPTRADFATDNAYYVWPRTVESGPRSPQWVDQSGKACPATTNRTHMTVVQSNDGVNWWNKQTGPRMLTLSYNSIHTPFQKAPTDVVADRTNFTSTCSSTLPQRRLLNNMLESIDVEVGRTLAGMGLGTLDATGRKLTSLHLGNTMVIIVGDNGSFGTTVRFTDGFSVLRSKATVHQTGVWVPLIVAGPIVSEPGRDVDELINVTDLFQLFGDIAGLKVKEVVPPTHLLDSKPMMRYLTSANAPAVRKTNFTQVGAGTFTPVPAERSWPCRIGNICNDTLFDRALCDDNGGTWYGPGGATQQTSCCAVAAADSSVSVFPWAQYATRNKRYKLVETEQIDCSAPLGPNDPKPYPWAEYKTKPKREFYDIARKKTNPTGMDIAAADKLKNCPDGQDPKTCLPKALRPTYTQLSNAMASIRDSATPQTTCRSLGDGNLDLRVNQADLDGWKIYNGKGPSQYDINLDAKTNAADRAIIAANLGTDCMSPCARAHLNRNGVVDARDMALLRKQIGVCDPVLCSGDLDGNGVVSFADINLMQQAQRTCNAATRKASKSP